MRKYRILELVITRDQTRNALHAPSRSLQESPQEGTAGTEPIPGVDLHQVIKSPTKFECNYVKIKESLLILLIIVRTNINTYLNLTSSSSV